MSSRKDKIHRMQLEQSVQEAAQAPTVNYNYRIDVELSGVGTCTKTTYMTVTGVPEDLPPEYEETVRHSAEAQFASVLNQRLYLEFYNEGKTSKDEQPVFFNLSKLDWVKIKNVIKLD